MKKLIWLLFLLPTGVFAQNQARMISGTNNITVCPYTIAKQDVTKLDVFITSSACAVSLPAATTGGYGKGSIFSVKNNGTGSVTITIGGGESIDGNPSVTLLPGAGMDIYSTGTGYSSQPGAGGGGGGGGGINPPAGDIGGNAVVPLVISTHLNSPLPILQGGTGTQTPALVAGTNITITGAWPNQTINSQGSCWENNGSVLPCEAVANAVPPLVATDNPGNTSTDITCPAAVGVGGSHASGCVPDPGASGTTTDYLGRDMAYHTSGSASTVKPDPASGIMYVAQICNGGSACSDSNDGLSWGSAKLTPYAALQALPNGATSPPTAGNGIVYVANDVNGIAYGGPVAGGHGGWWMFDSTDPNFSGGATGFMRVPTVGSVTMECAAPTGSVIHQGGAVCMEYWGGSTSNTQPAFWFATGSGKQVLRGFSFSNQATGGKIGIDSNNNRSGNTGTSSVWLDRVQVNLGNCFTGVGAGPALDIGGASFWINITHSSYSGCTTQDYTATASRTSNIVTLTLNKTGAGDIAAGSNAYIIVRNMTDPTFNGAFLIATASGTSITFAQNGPNASTSGGQVFPYSASAIGINSGTGPGAGFVYVDDTAVNGGGIWVQGGSNGAGVSVKNLVYEGNGSPDMSPVELLPLNAAGDTFIEVNDVQPADNTVPICGVEALKGASALFVTNALVCGSMSNQGGSVIGTASPLRQNMYGQYNTHSIAINSDSARRLFSPVAIRSANQVGLPSSWTTTGLTVTTGILAPDGTTGATKLANTSGGTINMNFNGFFSPTPTVGSYYVFGVWLRSETAGVLPIGPNFNLNSNGVGTGDFCAGSYLSGQGTPSITANVAQPSITGDGQWGWYSGVCKIITAPNSGQQRLDMNVLNNTTIDAYGPVLTLVTAGTITDNEAWEMANTMQSYPKAAAQGDVAMLQGQRFAMATPTSNFMYFMQGTPTQNRPTTWPDLTGTVGEYGSGVTPVNSDCVNWVVSGGVASLGDAGAACGSGGSGGITPSLQFSAAYFDQAGTVAHVGGVAGPTGPNSVPSFWVTIPSGSAATAPQPILAGIPGRTVSGASDTVLVTDRVSTITYTNAGATAVSLPGAGTTGFGSNFCFKMKVQGSSAVATVTPAAGTINGGATQTVLQGQQALVCSFDNSNYIATIADPPAAAGSNIALTRGDSSLSFASSAGGGTVTNAANSLPAGQLIAGNTYPDIIKTDLTGDCTTSGSVATTCTKINGTSFSGTTGHLVSFGATNVPADSTVVAANVNTSAGSLVSGNLVSANGTKTTADSTIVAANVLTAASASAATNQLAVATTTTRASAFKSLIDLSSTDYSADTGIVNALVACPASNPATALTTGMRFKVLPKFANTNISPATAALVFCSLTSKNITKNGTSILAANDMTTTAIADLVYDGTEFQLMNPQTSGGGGSSALSSITAAAATNTIGNGDFTQIWQWAQTTNGSPGAIHSGLTIGESGASTGGTVTNNLANQSGLQISTAAASTATPLAIQQGSITNTVAFPALQITSTWNNASMVGKAIVVSVTDTTSNSSSRIIDTYAGAAGTTSEFYVTKGGLEFLAGGLQSGGSITANNGTNTLTFQGGQDVLTGGSANGSATFRGAKNTATTANSAGGVANVQGGDENGATGTTIGGDLVMRGGAAASTNTGAASGNVYITGGACINVTTASTCPGGVRVIQAAFTTGGATPNDLACVTAANTLASCSGAGTGQFVGVIESVSSNNVFVTSIGGGGRHTFNSASIAFTNGDFICQDPTNGNLVVRSASVCAVGTGVGIYYGASATTTTPLVMMRPY